MEVAQETSFQKAVYRKVDLDCLPSFRYQRNPALPSRIPLTRVHTFPKAGGGGLLPHPRCVLRWIKLVSPFVVALCPAPPVTRKRIGHCLAAHSPSPLAPTWTPLPH